MTIKKLLAIAMVLGFAQHTLASDPDQFQMNRDSNFNIGVENDAVSIGIIFPVSAGICSIEISKDGIKSEMEHISQQLIIEGAGIGGEYTSLMTSIDDEGVMSIDLSKFRYEHSAHVRIRTRDGKSIYENVTHVPPIHELPLMAKPGLCNFERD